MNMCWFCGGERGEQARGAICGSCWPIYIHTPIRRHFTEEQKESPDVEQLTLFEGEPDDH
jgi:hypothetical protein